MTDQILKTIAKTSPFPLGEVRKAFIISEESVDKTQQIIRLASARGFSLTVAAHIFMSPERERRRREAENRAKRSRGWRRVVRWLLEITNY